MNRYRSLFSIGLITCLITTTAVPPFAYSSSTGESVPEAIPTSSIIPTGFGEYFASRFFLFLFPELSTIAIRELAKTERYEQITNLVIKKVFPKSTPEQLRLRSIQLQQALMDLGGIYSGRMGLDIGWRMMRGEDVWGALSPGALAIYTALFYASYKVVGEKVIMDRVVPYLDKKITGTRLEPHYRTWGGRLASVFGYEECNVVTPNAPVSRVILKPPLLLLANAISWPAYAMALIGEANFSAYTQFDYPHLFMWTMLGYFGFIWGSWAWQRFDRAVIDRTLRPIGRKAREVYREIVVSAAFNKLETYYRGQMVPVLVRSACGRALSGVGQEMVIRNRARSVTRNLEPFLLRHNEGFNRVILAIAGSAGTAALILGKTESLDNLWRSVTERYFQSYGELNLDQVIQTAPVGAEEQNPIAPDLEELRRELERLRLSMPPSSAKPTSSNERFAEAFAALETFALLQRGDETSAGAVAAEYPKMLKIARAADAESMQLPPFHQLLAVPIAIRNELEKMGELPSDWESRVLDGIQEGLEKGTSL